MTEKPKQTINITKARRGWDVETIVHWPGVKHPAMGYNQESTLAIALWKTVDRAFQVTEITVKGKVLTNRDAYQSIEDSLTRGRGRLAFMLPGYREALGL